MHVSSVIAANGAGHFRRSIGVLHRLLLRDPTLMLTIYCTDHQLDVMRNWWRLHQLSDLGAQFTTDIECGFRWPLKSPDRDLLIWRNRLADTEDFNKADLVVSDNLASVLAIRPDAVLMGSFLWSEVLAQADQAQAQLFVADETTCLRRYRPPMLCVEGIATPGVLRETSAVPLVWMCEQSATAPRTLDGAARIGICGGTTDAAADQVVQLAGLLAPRYDVVIDSAAGELGTSLIPGVRGGLQSDIPLTDVDIVLCRPGAGTVMDCVAANIPFLTFYEPRSPEMAHSASRLATLGVADTLDRHWSDQQILTAVEHLAEPANYRAASASLHALPKDGLNDAATWLAKRLQI